MMQTIRDKSQGIVAWVIVGIIAFVLIFWGVSGYISSGNGTVVAKVNGTEITSNEVNDNYNRKIRMLSMQKGFDVSQLDTQVIKQQITMGLANKVATVEGLNSNGLVVSDAMVLNAIRGIPDLQVDGKFSMDAYKQLLKQLELSESEFETDVREQLLLNQLQYAVMISSFVTKQEAERLVSLSNQTRDFGYAVISAANYLKNAHITDTQVEEFYNAHKQEFVVPDKVQVEYIELSLDDVMKEVQVSDQKLQEYYKANQQSFTAPRQMRLSHIMISAPTISDAAQSGSAKKQIDEIYAKLQKDGSNFAETAKKFSEDKQSAIRGGDLGWASNNEEYPAEVTILSNKGEFTMPIQTDYGWHIFQLTEVKGGGVKSFAEARSVILERFKRDEAERLFSAKGDELANLAFENPKSLLAASEKLHLPIKVSEHFTKQGGSGVAASPNVVQATFTEDVFVQGHNSELVRMSDDNYLVLRVKNKELSHEQTLDEVKPDIYNYLRRIAAHNEAKQVGDELMAVIKETNNPNKAASAQKIDWITKRNVERDNKDIDRDLLGRAFMVPKPVAGQAFTAAGFGLPNGDYVVVAVTKVQEGVIENAAESNQVEKMARHIAQAEGQLDFAAIQQALIEKANIKYYDGK